MRGWKRLTVVVLVAVLPACVRWNPVAIPVAPAPPNVIADRSRIRLTTGQRVEFLTLVVATDSIFGIRNNQARTRLTVSFDQVSRIEVRKKDPLRTMAVIGSIGLVMFYSGALGVRPR